MKQVAGIEGMEGVLIPPRLLIQECFAEEQAAIEILQTEIETVKAKQEELAEEHGGEEGLLAEVLDERGKVSKPLLSQRLKALTPKRGKAIDEEAKEEYDALQTYSWLIEEEAEKKKAHAQALDELEEKLITQYPKLTIDEIKTMVVEKKWMAAMEQLTKNEMDNISHRLTSRIKELADRYETPLPVLDGDLKKFTDKVEGHLKAMQHQW